MTVVTRWWRVSDDCGNWVGGGLVMSVVIGWWRVSGISATMLGYLFG